MRTGRLRLVLTGGIGSGKSTAASILRDMGMKVIDADRIGHEMLEPGGGAFRPVASRWPDSVLDGRIDRRALGRVVFGDPSQLGELESILHPLIAAEISRRVQAHPSDAPIVVEISVPKNLVGPGWLTIVVDSDEEVRLRRLVERGMPIDEIEARMAVQPDRKAWLAMADVVVDNSGSTADLAQRLQAVVESLESRLED